MDDFGVYSLSPAEAPTVSLRRVADQITVSFTGGATAVLEFTDSLSAPNWQPVAGVVANSITLTASNAQQYFLVVQP